MNTEEIYEQLRAENNAEFAKLGKTYAFLLNELKTNPNLTTDQRNKIQEECSLLANMRTQLASIVKGGTASFIIDGDPKKVTKFVKQVKEANGGVYAYYTGPYKETDLTGKEYGEDAKKSDALLGEISEFISFEGFDSYVPPTLKDTKREVSEKVSEFLENLPNLKAIIGKAQLSSKHPSLVASEEIETMGIWQETFEDFTYVPLTFDELSETSTVIPSNILYTQIRELTRQEKTQEEPLAGYDILIDDQPAVTEEKLGLIYEEAKGRNLLQRAFQRIKSFISKLRQDKGTPGNGTHDENLR